MNEYKIEVIIPVYNNEDTIERCLKSLKAQTFSSWRALIVDDASTDGSAAIVKKIRRGGRQVYLSPKREKSRRRSDAQQGSVHARLRIRGVFGRGRRLGKRYARGAARLR